MGHSALGCGGGGGGGQQSKPLLQWWLQLAPAEPATGTTGLSKYKLCGKTCSLLQRCKQVAASSLLLLLLPLPAAPFARIEKEQGGGKEI